jgi:DNA-binding CsgD family transcriptional regulator
MDMENAIRKYCMESGVTIHSLYSKEVTRDRIDKILGINRETIYFKLEGNYNILRHLQSQLAKQTEDEE